MIDWGAWRALFLASLLGMVLLRIFGAEAILVTVMFIGSVLWFLYRWFGYYPEESEEDEGPDAWD